MVNRLLTYSIKIVVILNLVFACTQVWAQQQSVERGRAEPLDVTLETLVSFVELQDRLNQEIEKLGKQIESSHSDLQTTALKKPVG